MRVWIYSRLSNDDDCETNSLLNQQEICRAFAEHQRDQIIGLFSSRISPVWGVTGRRRPCLSTTCGNAVFG